MKNKKGNVLGILFLAMFIMMILFLGFLMAFGGVVIDMVADEVVPVATSLGMVNQLNASEMGETVLNPVNVVVQQFGWITGVLYILGMVGGLGFAFAFRGSSNGWVIGLFLMIALLVVVSSMFMSNIYEDFYDDNDPDISARLHEQFLLSFLILYSPAILGVYIFICGIILFSGGEQVI